MDPVSKNPVAKKADGGKIADGGTPTPDDPPAPVIPTSAYLAVGDDGKIALSKDFGNSWQAVASGITGHLSDIATDGSNIVIVAKKGALVRSTDGGESWSIVSSMGSSSGTVAAEIEYGNGVFSTLHYATNAFSSGIQYEFYRSIDGGATWAKGTIASGLFSVGASEIGLAYDGSRFLAVSGLSGSETGTIAISTDGLAYTSGLGNGNLQFGNKWLSLRIANDRFFIFNFLTNGYNTPNIYQAPTGAWEDASPWTTNRHDSATDRATFPAAASSMFITDIAHSGSVYAFVGFDGTIMTSATAMAGSFTVPTSPATYGLRRIIFFKGKFVVAGTRGAIVNGNATGVTWTAITAVTTAELTIGEATANTIVFTGRNGKIIVSSDGTTWEEKSAAGNTAEYRRLLLIE